MISEMWVRSLERAAVKRTDVVTKKEKEQSIAGRD